MMTENVAASKTGACCHHVKHRILHLQFRSRDQFPLQYVLDGVDGCTSQSTAPYSALTTLLTLFPKDRTIVTDLNCKNCSAQLIAVGGSPHCWLKCGGVHCAAFVPFHFSALFATCSICGATTRVSGSE